MALAMRLLWKRQSFPGKRESTPWRAEVRVDNSRVKDAVVTPRLLDTWTPRRLIHTRRLLLIV
jgi:hypothetical protein